MTDEQKSRFATLQGAWLAVREERRRAEMAAELDAAIMEFLNLHRAEKAGPLFSCGISRQFLKPVCLGSTQESNYRSRAPHCREGRLPLSAHRAAESSLAAALLAMFR